MKKIHDLCKSLTDSYSTCTMRRYHKFNIMEIKKGNVSNTYYSKEEVCTMLKISISTLNRRIAGGELTATKVGGKILISQENLDRFLNGEY